MAISNINSLYNCSKTISSFYYCDAENKNVLCSWKQTENRSLCCSYAI